PMTITRNVANLNRGWRGPRDLREGRNQRLIRRAFAYRNILTTGELMRFVFPASDIARLPGWRWYAVRRAAERYGVRIGRRRPLQWRAKPSALMRPRNSNSNA